MKIKTIEDFLKATVLITMRKPLLTCNDGFKMSVQCGEMYFCKPQKDNLEVYTHVEIRCDIEKESSLKPYERDDNTAFDVPVKLINEIIDKHQGLNEEVILKDIEESLVFWEKYGKYF